MLLFLMTLLQGELPLTLFYKFFNCDESFEEQESSKCTTSDERVKGRKDKVARVVERLHFIYQFHTATTSRSLEADIQILNSDDVVPEFETGHFRLHQGDPFVDEMRVIWTTVNGLGIAFVCYGHENRVQAEISLRVITRQLHELCRLILSPNEILSKPEKVDILLTKFLPDGNPLLMNHRVIRQLERESEALLKAITN